MGGGVGANFQAFIDGFSLSPPVLSIERNMSGVVQEAKETPNQVQLGRKPTEEELSSIPPQWAKYIQEVLFSEDQILSKVKEMAQVISKDYTESIKDEVLLCLPVLKGATVFGVDLIRRLTCPYEIDFLNVSSYAGTESSGEVTLLSELQTNIKGRHVLVIEDLMDTGLTLEWLVEYLLAKEPASLRVAVLLNKEGRRNPKCLIKLDYVGYECPNKFVIGYGMDFVQQYRYIPYIGVLHPDAYKKPVVEEEQSKL